ncbi:MAG: 5-formyltetrahydrofolate cyclo-ligase [Pseudomonadota bacterium]
MKDWVEIRAWRKVKRAELVARREASGRAQRQSWNERITALLLDGFPVSRGTVIAYCWPFKDEFDARFAIRRWRERGAIAALPEVTAKAQPLQFRKWWPGAPMTPGVYDIPVPAATEVLAPDAALVPMNGFDEQCYRLGYGGGYFDRTLMACNRRLLAIGVAYEMLRLPTIYPQTHDIPMDFVVTEAAVYASDNGKLMALTAAQSRERAACIMQTRRLPRAAALSEEQGQFSSPPCYAGEFPGYFGDGGARD